MLVNDVIIHRIYFANLPFTAVPPLLFLRPFLSLFSSFSFSTLSPFSSSHLSLHYPPFPPHKSLSFFFQTYSLFQHLLLLLYRSFSLSISFLPPASCSAYSTTPRSLTPSWSSSTSLTSRVFHPSPDHHSWLFWLHHSNLVHVPNSPTNPPQ